MPFSDRNIRYTCILIAMVMLTLFGLAAGATILYLQPHNEQTWIIFIGGIVAPSLVILRQELVKLQIQRELSETRHSIGNNVAASTTRSQMAIEKADAVIQIARDAVASANDRADKTESLTNGNLQRAIETAVSGALAAQREQMLDNPEFARRFARVLTEEQRPLIIAIVDERIAFHGRRAS